MSSASEVARASQTSRRRRSAKTAIFSPPDPRRTDSQDDLEVNPPKRLAERFGFLLSSLPWHGELSGARTFLEKHKLVEEFDREAVLVQFSRTLQNERNKEILKGGLRWAFRLWRQPRAGNRPIRLQPQHRFRVTVLSETSSNWSDSAATDPSLCLSFLFSAVFCRIPGRLADRLVRIPDLNPNSANVCKLKEATTGFFGRS